MGRETYTTALSPEECLERLRGRSYTFADLERFRFSPPKEGTVFAKVRGNRFRLFAQGPKSLQNPFMPFFYGRLEAGAHGTRIHGRYGLHLAVRVFFYVWFGFLILAEIAILIAAVFGQLAPGVHPVLALGGVPVLLLIGVGMVQLGRSFGGQQRDSLDAFIRDVLEARPQWRSGPTR